MRTFKQYLLETTATDILQKFWDAHSDKLASYRQPGNCTTASRDLEKWLEANYPGANEGVVPAGVIQSGGKFTDGGFIQVDEPQFDKEDLMPWDKEIKSKGLDINSEVDRKKFVSEHSIKEQFKLIPHSWVEVSSQKLTGKYSSEPLILDPSGFLPDGSGQFDKLIKDKSKSKYKEWSEGLAEQRCMMQEELRAHQAAFKKKQSEKTGWLYHTTPYEFDKLKDQPTWFTKDLEEARGYQNNIRQANKTPTTRVYQHINGKIASKEEAAKIAREVWPNDKFIYSMFDERIGEYDKKDIKKFIDKLKDNGYVGAEHSDYSAINNQKDADTLVIFNPSQSLKYSHKLEDLK
jgi:hypothetical protein